MSETKVFKLIKVTPKDVVFVLHPLSNPSLSKKVVLTSRNPYQMLPLDWALGVFMDDGNYSLYKNKYITFENNNELVKAAYEAGAYFSDVLEFEPAEEKDTDDIIAILKTGNRAKIEDAMKKFGSDRVRDVAISISSELSVNAVAMLENLFKCQLIIDGDKTEE